MHVFIEIVASVRFWIIMVFVVAAVYIHYRGKLRHGFWRQLSDHSTFLAPINVFMYLFSAVPTKPYLSLSHFPELQPLQDNWQTIRDEAIKLNRASSIKAADGYTDAGFNSFFRRGWKRFYIKWYQTAHPSAQQLCPKTLALIDKIPNIKAAMFAQLPPGSKLVRHRDPYAGSLRYHLGLITPDSDDCAIIVDNERYSWRNGQAVMFDETYIHYAYNNTNKDRIILFCDIVRPMRYKFAAWINSCFARILLTASNSPNMQGDRTGFINKIFKHMYTLRLVGKRLKKQNKMFYYIVKYIIITGLIYFILFSW